MRSTRGDNNRSRRSPNYDLYAIPDPAAEARKEREEFFRQRREETQRRFGALLGVFTDVRGAEAAMRYCEKQDDLVAEREKARAAHQGVVKRAQEFLRTHPPLSPKLLAEARKKEMNDFLSWVQDLIWAGSFPAEILWTIGDVVNATFPLDPRMPRQDDPWGLFRNAGRKRIDLTQAALDAAENLGGIERDAGFRAGVKFLFRVALPSGIRMAREQNRWSDHALLREAYVTIDTMAPAAWFEERRPEAPTAEAKAEAGTQPAQ